MSQPQLPLCGGEGRNKCFFVGHGYAPGTMVHEHMGPTLDKPSDHGRLTRRKSGALRVFAQEFQGRATIGPFLVHVCFDN